MMIILDSCKTDFKTVEEYIYLKQERLTSVNKKRKDIDRNIQQILEQNKTIDRDVEIVSKYNLKRNTLKLLNEQLLATENTLETNVGKVISLLNDDNFIEKENIVFVEGKVENTIPQKIPSTIALLRLDTDWFESTYHELVHLYPILVKNGVLIIDDYGHWKGAKDATDQYFKENNIKMLLNRIDYTVRAGIKI